MSKSKGPRTARGKARSSQNAAKHWIESGRILPTEQKEAAVLRSGFVADFNPESSIENELLDDLVLNRLIKRRIDVAFTWEFYKASFEETIRQIEDYQRSLTLHVFWTLGSENEGVRKLAEPPSPDLCISLLEDLKSKVTERGPQLHDYEEFRALYGDQPPWHAAIPKTLLCALDLEQHAADGKAGSTAEHKKHFLDAIDLEIKLQRLRKHVSAISSGLYLQEPPSVALETLQRYRVANTREFKDLLDSFERVRRLGRRAS